MSGEWEDNELWKNLRSEYLLKKRNGFNVEEKKIVHGVETYWLPGKEKVSGAVVNQEGHADASFLLIYMP